MNSGPLSLRESLDIANQVASALEAAHKAGIVHRDIKPDNIMLRTDRYVKVLDFGLAKLTEQPHPTGNTNQSQSNTAAGLVLGTIKYMSPEQARGLDVDARSDIFSLCVVLYEMLTGKAPFEGETASDLIATILKDDPSPLLEYWANYPESLQEIISKGLKKDKDDRYLTISDFIDDLTNLKEQVDSQFKAEKLTSRDFIESRGSTTSPYRSVSLTPTWTKRFSSTAEYPGQ